MRKSIMLLFCLFLGSKINAQDTIQDSIEILKAKVQTLENKLDSPKRDFAYLEDSWSGERIGRRYAYEFGKKEWYSWWSGALILPAIPVTIMYKASFPKSLGDTLALFNKNNAYRTGFEKGYKDKLTEISNTSVLDGLGFTLALIFVSSLKSEYHWDFWESLGVFSITETVLSKFFEFNRSIE
ncbi:MAG: hypothetical protein PHE49_09615 [bacterium]|nr:hypothetical protein [bacterium]